MALFGSLGSAFGGAMLPLSAVGRGLASGAYSGDRGLASGAYSGGRGLASGGYSGGRELTSGGYSGGRELASGGYSGGRELTSGGYSGGRELTSGGYSGGRELTSGGYSGGRELASGGYSGGRELTSGGYSGGRELTSGGYSGGRELASGGYSGGRELASGAYGAPQLASGPYGAPQLASGSSFAPQGVPAYGGGGTVGGPGGLAGMAQGMMPLSALGGGAGGFGFGGYGALGGGAQLAPQLYQGAAQGYGGTMQDYGGTTQAMFAPGGTGTDMYSTPTFPGGAAGAASAFTSDPTLDPYRQAATQYNTAVNAANPEGADHSQSFYQGTDPGGGYIAGVGQTLAPGRSVTQADADQAVSAVKGLGASDEWIRDFLQRNPYDYSRLSNVWHDEFSGGMGDSNDPRTAGQFLAGGTPPGAPPVAAPGYQPGVGAPMPQPTPQPAPQTGLPPWLYGGGGGGARPQVQDQYGRSPSHPHYGRPPAPGEQVDIPGGRGPQTPLGAGGMTSIGDLIAQLTQQRRPQRRPYAPTAPPSY